MDQDAGARSLFRFCLFHEADLGTVPGKPYSFALYLLVFLEATIHGKIECTCAVRGEQQLTSIIACRVGLMTAPRATDRDDQSPPKWLLEHASVRST